MSNYLGTELVKLLKSNQYHLLYKDWPSQDAEIFIITKHMEIFEYDNNILGLYVWSRKVCDKVRKNWAIWEDEYLNEGFTVFRVKKANLPDLLAFGVPSRRIGKNSKRRVFIEKLLGHPIITYKTKIKEC